MQGIACTYLFVEFSKKREKVSATGFVGRVTLKGEPMVVLVTNNHVFQTLEQAMNASYQFGFQSNSGRWQPEEIKGKDLIVENKQFFFSHQVCHCNNRYRIAPGPNFRRQIFS